MYLPDTCEVLDRRSIVTTPTPLNTSPFTLDTSGVSGFFGGDEAISAMAAVYIYRGQRWLGWYNTPGSNQIAMQYGRVARSAFFRAFFPGTRTNLTELFGFEGQQGPRFQAVSSGVILETTGHLASVLIKECDSINAVPIAGRVGASVGVTIVRLNTVPSRFCPKRTIAYCTFFGIVPIASSFAACIASGVYKDWFSFSLILWGILSNGVTHLVLGSGILCFSHPVPAAGSPPGDGILGTGREFVLLQGDASAISSITLGKFSLEFPHKSYDKYIGWCSMLLIIQFIAQLFLIPQASLFGQIMFIASLAVSWVYNLWLSAYDREEIQRHTFEETLNKPSLEKYILPTRTAAVVFSLCALSPEDPNKLLEAYLPTDTKVWRKWKETVSRQFCRKEALHFEDKDWNLPEYSDQERTLLRTLYGDTQVAYDGFASIDSKETPVTKSG